MKHLAFAMAAMVASTGTFALLDQTRPGFDEATPPPAASRDHPEDSGDVERSTESKPSERRPPVRVILPSPYRR